MNWISFLIGLSSGLVIGAGIVLLYVKRQFTHSLSRFEEEMDFLDQLEEDMKKEEE